MAQAAHHTRLVADADLAHVDAHMQARRKRAHQLTEVDAVLGFEVEHCLVAVEQVLHRNRAHLLGGLRGKLLEHGERLGGAGLELGLLGAIFVIGHAQDGLQRGFQLLDLVGRCLERRLAHMAELGSPGGLDHDVASGVQFQLARIEPQRFGVVGQVDRRYANHGAPSFYLAYARGAALGSARPYSMSRTSSSIASMHVSGDTL